MSDTDNLYRSAGLQLKLAANASPSAQSGASGTGNLYLNSNEDAELNQHLPVARDAKLAASVADLIAPIVTFIPDISGGFALLGTRSGHGGVRRPEAG